MLRQQATRLMRSAMTRCGAGERFKSTSTTEPAATYTYLPPGCSMREPTLISMSDPVYFYDLPPSRLSVAQQHAMLEQEEKAKQAAAGQQQASAQQQQQQAGLKAALSAVLPTKAAPEKPVSYRMADDLSNQTYTVSLNNSMREPRLISVADPSYQVPTKPAAGAPPAGKKQ